MSKNNTLTHLDPNQLVCLEHDNEHDAKRVVLVGGEKLELTIDSDKIVNAVKEGLNSLTLPKGQTSGELQVINIPTKENVFIPQIEIKTIEIPVIIKEIEYREIEKPIIIEKIVTIEKPVVIKEIEFKEIVKEQTIPKWQKFCFITQTIVIIGLLIVQIINLSHLK